MIPLSISQIAGLAVASLTAAAAASQLVSPFYRIELHSDRPAASCWSLDSLGGGRLEVNPILSPSATGAVEGVSLDSAPGVARLRKDGQIAWTLAATGERSLELSASPRAAHVPPFELLFDMATNHATLLGVMAPGDRRMPLPCVLHLPDLGTMRITSAAPGGWLEYDASRRARPRFVRVRFPPSAPNGTPAHYRLDVIAIHPTWPELAASPLYDGVRRNFLNIFQINPRFQMLANNAASDPVAFVLHFYADMAAASLPPLAEGLTCLDLLRMTLDRYLSGVKGYGMAGYGTITGDEEIAPWNTPWTTTDTYPSLLLAACRYVESSGDTEWARRRWTGLRGWAAAMVERDTDDDGLIEYPATGNYGDRPLRTRRPANWWDTINFGHEDAYSNALAYQAARQFAALARRLGRGDDAEEFDRRADRLRQAYVPGFFNPSTGVLAGWRSADGQLHDYWFTFVNGAAIALGLIENDLGHAIMDRFLAKMMEVGFTNFALGLPGNLVPIRRGDYVHHNTPPEMFGEPRLEDGSDGFQFYQNGGATACFAWYFIRALYRLGRIEDARHIFHPMLRAYAAGEFQGFDASGRSRDWRNWRGGGHGYEGLLVDSYHALLAAEDDVRAGPPGR